MLTSIFVLLGRPGAWRYLLAFGMAGMALGALGCLWWRAWSPLVARDAAGVALAHIHLHFAWQAWHLWHWAGSGRALGCRLSPGALRHFAWQAWHLGTSTFHLRDKGGTWRHPPWFRVAAVALMALGSALSHMTLSHTTPSHATLSQTILSQTHTHNSFICTTLAHQTLLSHIPPLSFLPPSSCFNFCFSLLEEVDLWGYPVL